MRAEGVVFSQPIFTTCPSPAARTSSKTLRVATYNVHYAEDPVAIAREICGNERLSAADLIFLQEVESHPHEETGRAEKIALSCGFHSLYAPAREAGRGSHGVAVLSKHALKDFYVVPLGWNDLGFRSRQRIALACSLDLGGVAVRLYNVHLDTRINSEDRLKQLCPVLADADLHPRDKTVIAGDFNTVPFRFARNMVPYWVENQERLVRSHLRSHGFDSFAEVKGHTSAFGALKMRLDSIYARGVSISGSGIETGVKASDHRPLWADLAVR